MKLLHLTRFLVLLLVLLSTVCTSKAISCREQPPFLCQFTSAFNSSLFGEDFLFGASTSSYQIEGAARRGLNTWDSLTHRTPEKTADRGNGDEACNSTYLYKDDVALLKSMGAKAYRFSIAWSRVLPGGKISRGINEEGVGYYNNLINELKRNGIEPFVTIFHWDLPQSLQDEYRGFLSREILDDFQDYAELCFQRFGDRVKYWITLNQPYTLAMRGHALGTDAPGRCSDRSFCNEGNSGTEPYIVTHHQILAHARVAQLYREKYKSQGGFVGTTLITQYFLPLDENSDSDKKAAARMLEFFIGWYMNPLTYGDYPQVMKDYVGNRLPNFTAEESRMVKGSLDFMGLNYYVTQYATDTSATFQPFPPDATKDSRVKLSFFRGDKPIGPKAYFFYYYPKGFQGILTYVKEKYNNPLIYITENGFADSGNVTIEKALDDRDRIQYHCSHLCFLRSAIQNGSNVKGYFPWSLMDNFEFGYGFTARFGMNYVNFNNPSDRRPKRSGQWYKRFLTPTMSRNKQETLRAVM